MEIKYPKMVMKKIGEQQVKHPFLVIILVFLFTLLVAPGMFLIYFDTSNENFLPSNDPVVVSIFRLGNEFKALNTMNLVFVLNDVEGGIKDLRDPLFLKKLDLFEQSLIELDYVDEVNFPTSELKKLNHGVLPKEKRLVEELFHKNPGLKNFYNKDYSVLKGTLASSISLNEGTSVGSRKNVKKEIEDHFNSIGFPKGVEFRVWSFETQFIELEQNMGKDLAFTSMIAFIVIFLLILFFYRSIVFAVLSLIPIVFALVWTIGTMGYVGLPFTMLTTGFIPIVLGFGIDFSIHLIHGINHLKTKGKKIEDAVIETMSDTGESLFGSTITTAIGFISLLLASLLITQRLGLTLSIAVVYVFLGSILMVPPIVLVEEKIIKKIVFLFNKIKVKLKGVF